MDVIVRDLVSGADTNDQGDVVLRAVLDAISRSDRVILDFSGVNCATSSFVNSSLVPLLDSFSYDEIKRRIGFSGTNRQIAMMIRARMDFESGRLAAA